MTYQPVASPSRLSKSSLTSFVLGILGCIPFIAGALAVAFGIAGLMRTGKPGVTGRWMAVVGLILGLISLGGWTLGFGGVYAIWKGTEGPRVATHDFIQNISNGNDAAARAKSIGMDDEEFKSFAEFVRKQ